MKPTCLINGAIQGELATPKGRFSLFQTGTLNQLPDDPFYASCILLNALKYRQKQGSNGCIYQMYFYPQESKESYSNSHEFEG
jgi:hypothetical protein